MPGGVAAPPMGGTTNQPLLVRLGSQSTTLPPGTQMSMVQNYRARGAEITTIETPQPPSSGGSEPGASHYVDELMTLYRRAYAPFVQEMEVILEEMIVKLRQKPEEDFLTTLHSVLYR